MARQDAAARIQGTARRAYELRKGLDTGRETLADLKEEIDSLRSRRSNIPRRNLEVRTLVARGTGIAEADLPFAGELIRVRPQERAWEPALEKLLHNFALCVLVPDDAYRAVNAFVKDNDLRGRLVYFRVPAHAGHAFERDLSPQSAVSKLEIKPRIPQSDWLDDHLRTHFDYSCTDDLEDFARLGRGISGTGLRPERRTSQRRTTAHCPPAVHSTFWAGTTRRSSPPSAARAAPWSGTSTRPQHSSRPLTRSATSGST